MAPPCAGEWCLVVLLHNSRPFRAGPAAENPGSRPFGNSENPQKPRDPAPTQDPSVLKVKIEIKIQALPPGPGPKPRLLKDNDSPDPPSGPPAGGEGDKENIKSVLEHSWEEVSVSMPSPYPERWRVSLIPLESVAAMTSDITSTIGIELIGPAPDFSSCVRYWWSRRRFL